MKSTLVLVKLKVAISFYLLLPALPPTLSLRVNHSVITEQKLCVLQRRHPPVPSVVRTGNMASARKKQDEKNLKVLRELASLPNNKYCFDCNQRGPTYVNVTIGSFVCTKCSGML